MFYLRNLMKILHCVNEQRAKGNEGDCPCNWVETGEQPLEFGYNLAPACELYSYMSIMLNLS